MPARLTSARLPPLGGGAPLDPVDVLSRSAGHLPLADLLAWTSRHHLGRAVAAGRVLRIAHGVYGLPCMPDAERAAAAAGGVLSHTSAAASWDMQQVRRPTSVHVSVRRGRRPAPQPGVTLHWTTLSDVELRAGRTCPRRTVLDCALSLPFAEALAVADSALGDRQVDADELLAAATAARGPGRARGLRVARAADGRASNPFESCLRAVVLERGLRGFEPQLPVQVAGRTRHADLGCAAAGLLLEADSFGHHGSRTALVADCERYDQFVAEGWRVLRFAYEHVMFRSDWVGDVICRTLGRRGVAAPAPARHNPFGPGGRLAAAGL